MPKDVTSSVKIQATKRIISEQGSPHTIFSDNGPQFASQQYKQFCKDWKIVHKTSSTHYPRLNGFVKRMIQTIKSTITEVQHVWFRPRHGIVSARNPIYAKLPSPGELLYRRRLQTNLPVIIKSDDPQR
ncbi:uncharacterized protein K02A2.6-like [Anneissia japonica]|uniref:uncharacterized protein K02A2.6-like n=1 Tax=Anneissia japonica TaxID=1529436 RepID=UPI0014255556|nr:uncharacterized protein K02A2.6-like [Anneissia japonica]